MTEPNPPVDKNSILLVKHEHCLKFYYATLNCIKLTEIGKKIECDVWHC